MSASKGTVLVVEDDPDQRSALVQLLEDEGYTAVPAGNGDEALQTLRSKRRPDVLLVDLGMPRMDGATLFRICDSVPELARIPRVVVSGHSASETFLEVCRAKAFIRKPVDVKRLLDAIAAAMSPAQ